MDASSIALLTTLISVCFGVITVIIAYVLNSREADRTYRLKKLEEVFNFAQSHCHHLIITYSIYSHIANGDVKYEDRNKRYKYDKDAKEENYFTLLGIVNIYFQQSLAPSLRDIETLKDSLVKPRETYIHEEHEDGLLNEKYRNIFNEAAHKFEILRKDFNLKIFQTADEIRHETILSWLKPFAESDCKCGR